MNCLLNKDKAGAATELDFRWSYFCGNGGLRITAHKFTAGGCCVMAFLNDNKLHFL